MVIKYRDQNNALCVTFHFSILYKDSNTLFTNICRRENKTHMRKSYTRHEVEVQFALVYYAITLINMLKSTTVEEAVRKRIS